MQPHPQLPISPRYLLTPKSPSISDDVTCESDTSSQYGNPESVIFSALCKFDFTSSETGLLSFRKNEILDIVKCTDGWWAAMRKGGSIVGWIPQTFVTPLTLEMAEKLRDIREDLRDAELKRVGCSADNTVSLSVIGDGSASYPILEHKDTPPSRHDHSDIRKGQKLVHPSQSPSHSRVSPTTSIHHRPLGRSASTTQINFLLTQPKIDDASLRGGSMSIRSPRRHPGPVIFDDDVTLSQISTVIRSTDFKQVPDNLAASYRDAPFRTISNPVFKPAQPGQEDKLPRKFTEAGNISFRALSGAINKEIRKEKVVPGGTSLRPMGIDKEMERQGKAISPGGVISIGHLPSDGTPWHLRPQYADQLDIDDKGNVRSGSLLSLVEMLTFPPNATKLAQYKTFTNVFLMTFRTFTTADHLFDMLVQRFHFKPSELLTDSEYLGWKANLRIPVQRLVLEIFSRWLENYQLLEEEPHIVHRLKDFLALIVSPPHNKLASIIIHKINRMKSTKSIRVISSLAPKKARKSKLDLFKHNPKIIADQLTLYEFDLYGKITPQQCLTYLKTRTGDDVAKLRAFCSTHDKLDAWVKMSILNDGLTAGKRAHIVDFWIKVAERCRALNNISSMSAVITALSSTVITKLQLTWAFTCRKSRSLLDGLLRHSEPTGGFAGYRILLQRAEGPCVPFITMFLTEMAHVDQLPGIEGRISFYQQSRWYDTIAAMLMFQSRPYNIAVNESTINFIEDQLEEGIRKDSGWFWTQSLVAQEDEATHADIRRGLEAAGF